MTPEAQRIAIAVACGWKKVRINERGEQVWEAPPSGGRFPDYPNDLNAMHEAEKVLEEKQIRAYIRILWEVMAASKEAYVGTIHATASQRAEAFLKAIGLWETP